MHQNSQEIRYFGRIIKQSPQGAFWVRRDDGKEFLGVADLETDAGLCDYVSFRLLDQVFAVEIKRTELTLGTICGDSSEHANADAKPEST